MLLFKVAHNPTYAMQIFAQLKMHFSRMES